MDGKLLQRKDLICAISMFDIVLVAMSLVMRFQKQGSANDRSRRGRGRSVLTPENTEDVRRSIEENPTTSTRRRSQELAISRNSLQRIQRVLHMTSLQSLH